MSHPWPVVDCDVHHTWASRKELLPYLDDGWREFVSSGNDDTILPFTTRSRFPLPGPRYRDDAFPDEGPPGSDQQKLVADHLDAQRIGAAILTHEEGRFVDTNPNPHYAAAFARACNDWTAAEWLNQDQRLYGSIVVSNQVPSLGADEIRRMAENPKMKQVLIADNGIGKHFGHPLFDPIHAAAAEVGLPIAIHAPIYGGVTPAAAGQGAINYFLEHYTLIPESFMSHLTSFITNGVFDRYPSLRLILLESGIAWIPSYLWRLDANYKGLRREIPWAARLPSQYFRSHVRVSLNPLETGPKLTDWHRLVKAIGGPDSLVFGSGYPQWDSVSVEEVAAVLPEAWLAKAMTQNALELYGLGDAMLASGRPPAAA